MEELSRALINQYDAVLDAVETHSCQDEKLVVHDHYGVDLLLTDDQINAMRGVIFTAEIVTYNDRIKVSISDPDTTYIVPTTNVVIERVDQNILQVKTVPEIREVVKPHLIISNKMRQFLEATGDDYARHTYSTLGKSIETITVDYSLVQHARQTDIDRVIEFLGVDPSYKNELIIEIIWNVRPDYDNIDLLEEIIYRKEIEQ